MDLEKINYDELEERPLNEKTQIKIDIINNLDLIKIPVALLPGVHSKEYYFISYSHKDYKTVYQDLFMLENEKLNFWYDRGIPAGSNWKDIATKYIAPFDCKGVIFYISENSLLSNAIYEEMAFVKKLDKPFICIHLPFSKDYTHNGESVKGSIFSIRNMLDIMLENGEKIDKKSVRMIKTLFPDKILYLDINMPAKSKIEKIKSYMPVQPLILFNIEKNEVNGVIDPNVTQIRASDFLYHIRKIKKWKIRDRRSIWINGCSFANLRYLETISFPKKYFFTGYNYCFYNCHNLKTINGTYFNLIDVPIGFFRNCFSLTNPYTAPTMLEEIGEEAYRDCVNLKFDFKKHTALEKIGKFAFSGCLKIKSVHLSESVKEIGDLAFKGCISLKTVDLNMVENIGQKVFLGCPNIESFKVSNNSPSFSSRDGVLYSKDFTELYHFPPKKKDFNIDGNVTYIHEYVCYGNTRIESVIIPSHVKETGAYSFFHCNKIKTVHISEGFEVLGYCCFCYCDSLEEVYLPSTLKEIESGALDNCPRLKKVVFGGTINQLKDNFNLIERLDDIKIKTVKCSDGVCKIPKIKYKI